MPVDTTEKEPARERGPVLVYKKSQRDQVRDWQEAAKRIDEKRAESTEPEVLRESIDVALFNLFFGKRGKGPDFPVLYGTL